MSDNLIKNLDNLLEAKLENFLPHSDSVFDIIKNKIAYNKKLFNKKILLLDDKDIHGSIEKKAMDIEKSLASNFTDIDIYTLAGYKEFINRIFDLCPVNSHHGYFIKENVARKILEDVRPDGIIEFFSYKSLDELFDNINPLDVLTISRYSEIPQWQEIYKQRLSKCTVDNFEKRKVTYTVFDYNLFHKILANSGQPDKPWRLSHNKVSGSIMCFNPNEEGIFRLPFLQYTSVFIHYFFETAFAGFYYSHVLQKNPNKIGQSVLNSFTNHDDKFVFFHPNVYSETLYWQKAVDLIIERFKDIDFSFFKDTLDCGYFFEGKKISLNFIDHIWDVNIKEGPYLYHFKEAFWKNIFQDIMHLSDNDFEKIIIDNLDMKDLQFTDYIMKNFNK